MNLCFFLTEASNLLAVNKSVIMRYNKHELLQKEESTSYAWCLTYAFAQRFISSFQNFLEPSFVNEVDLYL